MLGLERRRNNAKFSIRTRNREYGVGYSIVENRRLWRQLYAPWANCKRLRQRPQSSVRSSVGSAGTLHELHMLEAAAAIAYWSGWETISINFPKSDLPRVPEHWKSFRARRSPISGSQRVAADPVNAMLNYLYALLESESRLAVAALGLDPGLGFLHFDSQSRDSLANDVMEPVRPQGGRFRFGLDRKDSIKAQIVL